MNQAPGRRAATGSAPEPLELRRVLSICPTGVTAVAALVGDRPVGFGWGPGDFVIWDNLAIWHDAVDDYDGPRVYRKVIGG
jgi:hypothetical protein